MINRELIEVFSEIAREKNVERSELASIMEELFLYVIEKEYGDSSNCSCIVNLDKGEIEIYAEKTIVDEVDDYKVEITLEDALAKEPDAVDGLNIGDIFVEVIDLNLFGRRLITTAKQFFAQRLRDVERNYIYEDYANRIGEIVIGVVHQVQRDNVFINIEQAELRMPKKEQILSERYRRNDTIRAVIKSVEVTSKGPDIVVSRSDNHFLHKLFEMEVPEIEDSIIEIISIARYPGERAKIIAQGMRMKAKEDKMKLLGKTSINQDTGQKILTKDLYIDQSNGQKHYYSKNDTTYLATDNKIYADGIDMDMRKEIVQLLGKVKILQNSGSKINTEDLIVDQSEGNEVYRTKERIRYQSKVADIHATGMRYDAKKQKIKLTGGVVGRYE